MIRKSWIVLAGTLAIIASVPAAPQTERAKWKVLIYVASRATVISGPGPVKLDRFAIEDQGLVRINDAALIFKELAEKESGGNLEVEFEIREDQAPIFRIQTPEGFPSPDPLIECIGVRFNEARFESDDKTFRGPYSSVFVIDAQFGAWHPGSRLARTYDVLQQRFGTPVALMSLVPTSGGEGPRPLAEDFLGAWRAHVFMRAGGSMPLPQTAGFWNSVPEPGAPVRTTARPPAFLTSFNPQIGVSPGAFSPVEPLQTENGTGAKVTISPGLREGEVLLLDGLGANRGATPVLEFWVQTTTPDPVELRLQPAGIRVTLGEVLPLEPAIFATPKSQIGIPTDGSWKRVRIPLPASEGGTDEIQSISIGFPSSARNAESNQFGKKEFTLAGVRFLASGDPADSNEAHTPTELLRIRELASATTAQSVEALAETNTRILTAALYRLAFGPEVAPEPATQRLQELARSAQPSVAMLALRVLFRMNSEEARKTLQYAVEVGPFEHCRYAMAQLLAEKPDPVLTPKLANTLTARDWTTRLMAVKALSKLVTRETTIILLAMLPDPDANVRRAICSNVDLALDLANRRLLFAAVNDPVEAVRIAAYQSLLSRGLPDYKAEALKGVREESPYVRYSLLEHIQKNPSPEFRRTALVGLTDRDPRVRLMAIGALKAQSGEVKQEELAGVLSDPDPEVRAAAAKLLEGK